MTKVISSSVNPLMPSKALKVQEYQMFGPSLWKNRPKVIKVFRSVRHAGGLPNLEMSPGLKETCERLSRLGASTEP